MTGYASVGYCVNRTNLNLGLPAGCTVRGRPIDKVLRKLATGRPSWLFHAVIGARCVTCVHQPQETCPDLAAGHGTTSRERRVLLAMFCRFKYLKQNAATYSLYMFGITDINHNLSLCWQVGSLIVSWTTRRPVASFLTRGVRPVPIL